jgi:hypothetical protein
MIFGQGPNVKKLIILRMSTDVVPANGGIGDAVKFLMNIEAIKKSARDATQWVGDSINSIRKAADPNPWKNSSDEEIAEEILKRI